MMPIQQLLRLPHRNRGIKATSAAAKRLLEWLDMYGRVEGTTTPGFSTTALGLSRRDVLDAYNDACAWSAETNEDSSNCSSSSSSHRIPHFITSSMEPSLSPSSSSSTAGSRSHERHLGTLRLPRYPLHCWSGIGSGEKQLDGAPASSSSSLAMHAAVLDEITTWALVLADPRQGRAGVSVALQAQRGPYHGDQHAQWMKQQQQQQQQHQSSDSATPPGRVLLVDLEATVTKIGRNLGFVRGAIYLHDDDDDQQQEQLHQPRRLLSHGSQVKYLPMGWWTDFALSSRGWPLTQLYCKHVLQDPHSTPPTTLSDEQIFESFQIFPQANHGAVVGDTLATFTATKAHASLGGTIHGGCQAVLLERAAKEIVRRLQGDNNNSNSNKPNVRHSWQLDSISVEYLSTPSRHVGLRVVESIPSSEMVVRDNNDNYINNNNNNGDLTLRVQLFNIHDGRVNSEGLLRYSWQR